MINKSIFKAYDIRGIYGTDITSDTAKRIGKAYATIIKRENPDKNLHIAVGMDMRLSSEELKNYLIEGLLESGIDVTFIGLVSTPTFYFGVANYNFDGGIQVSASHNPGEYNGFKIVRANGVPVSGDSGLYEMADLAEENEFPDAPNHGKIHENTHNILEDLLASQINEWKIDTSKIKPFKIVVDAANAMGALDVEAMFADLPCEIIKLNFKLDGTFPAHEADPLKDENLKILSDAVKEHEADLGIAPDGDGDRYFFVDEKGEIIRQEIMRGIMAQQALKLHPNTIMHYDIRPGKITIDMIEEAGGIPQVGKVGHSLIKEQMLETGAYFSGESSGHFFYRMSYGVFEAPVVYVLGFLEYISEKNMPVSEIIAPYKKYFHSGEINSDVKDKDAVFAKLKEVYKDAKISELDGVMIEYNDFWFNVRASNTEPKMRLNLEAVSQDVMEAKRDEVLDIIRG